MPHEADPDLTTMHVGRALEGDARSLEWVVGRLSPLLRANADHRLGARLRRMYDPDDLVNEVWATALPKLGELTPRAGRCTPMLVRFLSSILVNKVNRLLEKHILGKPARVEELDAAASRRTALLDRRPDPASGVITRAIRHEANAEVHRALDELAPIDREVIVLRGIEQGSPAEVAAQLGIERGAVAVRYHRALRRLRERLPGSVFDELPDHAA